MKVEKVPKIKMQKMSMNLIILLMKKKKMIIQISKIIEINIV